MGRGNYGWIRRCQEQTETGVKWEARAESEHDELEEEWGGWAPEQACCPTEEQGRCSWQITLCLDAMVSLGRLRGWEEGYQHGT